MSCYSDGDLLSYRVAKRRGGKGFHTFTGTVRGDFPAGADPLVWNHALGTLDCVPVETITMHQPSLLAG